MDKRSGILSFLPGSKRRRTRTALEQFANLWSFVIWFAFAALILLAIGIGLVEGKYALALTFFAVAAVYSIGAGMLGVFLGFLFGIPRVLADASTPATSGTTRAGQLIGTNTNLERISDWLTGAIVALSLANLEYLLTLLDRISEAAGKAFGATTCPGTTCDRTVDLLHSIAPALSTAITLIGLVAGFLIGYVSTRVFLSRMFSEVERDLAAFNAAEDRLGQTLKDAVDNLISSPGVTKSVAAQSLIGLSDDSDVKLLAELPNENIARASTARTVADARIVMGDHAGASDALAVGLKVAQGQVRDDLIARQKLLERLAAE